MSNLTETQYDQLKSELVTAYKDLYATFDKKDFKPKKVTITGQIEKHFGLIASTAIATLLVMAIAQRYERAPSIDDYLSIPF